MIRPIYRIGDSQTSELSRAVSLAETETGPHPRTGELLRRDRVKDETRRLSEFLRIERGRLA